MSWTEERIERLKKMWHDGATASQIADELGGVSRNAVIGKAHRLGLEQRPSPVKPGEEKESKKAAPAAAAQKVPAPKAETATSGQLDINSASEKELANLKGIGDAYAKAIVKHRPYRGKDDLITKEVLPKNVYDGIKDQIIAKQKK